MHTEDDLQVIVLRALRTKLAEALAQVHAAASLLHLRAPKKALQNGDLHPQLLLDLAEQNIHQCAAMTAKVPLFSCLPAPPCEGLKGILLLVPLHVRLPESPLERRNCCQ